MVGRKLDVAFPRVGAAIATGAIEVGGRRNVKPLLLCLSHLRWDFVWQRPQHLLSRAAAEFDVVVFEEPIWREDAVPTLEITRRSGGIRVAVPILPWGVWNDEAAAAQRKLLERFLDREPSETRVFWYYTPMAMGFSANVPADAVIYDNMDELSAFRGASPEMLLNEEELFARADLVFTGGMSLFQAKRGRHPSVHAFPSSIDAAHFGRARRADRKEPADQAAIPGPRLGFFGVIDERLNLDLVEAVAALRPDWNLMMIGPVAKIDPSSLPQRPNIHWLGSKSYDELPGYLGGWDAGFMPFALNEATRFISPTKTPEFLAAGVPVVSTSITDVINPYGRKGLVEIADSASDVVAAIDRVMARPKAAWLQAVDRQLATGSWDATWAVMRDLVAGVLREPLGSAAGAGASVSTSAVVSAE